MQEFKVSKRLHEKQVAYVDVDETICFYSGIRRYDLAEPNFTNISKINNLFDKGWTIIYWTARGSSSGIDYKDFTRNQLKEWGCKFHDLICGKEKGSYNLVIDDKAKRIEEIRPHKIGFTCGSFDLLHPGHVMMLEDCKKVCDYVIAAVQIDPTLDRPDKNKPVQSIEERITMTKAIKYVDEVRTYTTEQELYNMLIEISPDVRIVGSDWKGKSNFTGGDLDIFVHYHNRDHDHSTTNLRKRVFKAESK